jgi:hypothetical protein
MRVCICFRVFEYVNVIIFVRVCNVCGVCLSECVSFACVSVCVCVSQQKDNGTAASEVPLGFADSRIYGIRGVLLQCRLCVIRGRRPLKDEGSRFVICL